MELWYACSRQPYDQILLLIENGTVGGFSDINAVYGAYSPLYVASSLGRCDIVELLLSHGANVDLANIYGVTPLMIAVENCHGNVVVCLLNHGADPNHQSNGSGSTCLHKVTNVEIAKLLLDVGCDLTLVDKNYLTAKERAHVYGLHLIADLIEHYECPLIKEPESN